MTHYLKNENYSVTEASCGKDAFKEFEKNSFDLVVSDISMPNGTGLELLSQVREKNTHVPFIIITGFSELLDGKDAFDHGANELITKPFQKKVFLDKTREVMQIHDGFLKPTQKEKIYLPIPTVEILRGHMMAYDRYIKLNKDKYIVVARAGEPPARERISNYQSKGICDLFVLKEEYDAYLEKHEEVSKYVVRQSSKISKEKKALYITRSKSILFNQVKLLGLDAENFEKAEKNMDATLNLALGEDLTFKLLESLSKENDFLYAHALGVSFFSSLLAEKLGFGTKSSILSVSLGGLFHDIGKMQMDEKLYSTPMHLLKPEEREEYEAHPLKGYDQLSTVEGIPDIVPSVALQHHETCTGDGYPRGIMASKISRPAKIVGVVNEFCNLTIKNPRFRTMSAAEAIMQIKNSTLRNYDKEIYFSLRKVFRIL